MVARRKSGITRLTEWVQAREDLRLLKESGAPEPWTSDPILRMYRFTNIRRRDDRVSRWLRREVIAPMSEPGSQHELTLSELQFIALCRFVNWPPTIAAIIEEQLWPVEHLNLKAIGNLIDARTASGEKAWTGAYMVRAQPGYMGGKGLFVAEQVVGAPLRRAWPEMQFMLQTGMRRPVWRVLVDCLNWGSFMSGQVVDDLTWTPALASPRDNYTWAPQGPGSLRGLNRVLGLPLGTKHEEMEWCLQLQEWREVIVKALGKGYDDFTLMDLQSCLCEFDKYERVRLGQGRPRSHYRPETAY